MPMPRPLWWTYSPTLNNDTDRRDVTVYVGPPASPPRLVHLKNVNRQEIAEAGLTLFELEQIRYETKGANDGT